MIMKPEFENIPVINNTDASRFELVIDGYTAFIDYINKKDNVVALIHTESPAELAGRGAATALIEKTLHYFEENNLVLIPLCPLVFAFIKKNKEWVRIVQEGYKTKFDV